MMIVKIYIGIVDPAPDKLIHHVVLQDISIYSAIIDPAVVPRFYRNGGGKSFCGSILKAHGIVWYPLTKYIGLSQLLGKYVKNNELALSIALPLNRCQYKELSFRHPLA